MADPKAEARLLAERIRHLADFLNNHYREAVRLGLPQEVELALAVNNLHLIARAITEESQPVRSSQPGI